MYDVQVTRIRLPPHPEKKSCMQHVQHIIHLLVHVKVHTCTGTHVLELLAISKYVCISICTVTLLAVA